MKKYLLFNLFVLLAGPLASQFSIGHTTITFIDASRNNRQIATEIYYPADSPGNDVAVAAGTFPVVNYGHGFVMVWSAYQNIWEAVVPPGYIVCLPKTEGSITPNHTEFAKDLAFLCAAMTAQNTLPGSLFFNHVEPKFAVMGHSMGGGCAILSKQYSTSINAVGAMAPANTTPSAIAAAGGVKVPTLIFAGSYDCIAPPVQHALPIWQALAPDLCKLYVDIAGGSHCQFANSNANCTLGEVVSGCSSPPITRPAQQALVNLILLPWLDIYLKDDQSGWTAWTDILQAASGFSKLHVCAALAEDEADAPAPFSLKIMENPLSDAILRVKISGLNAENGLVHFQITDVAGRVAAIFSQKMAAENCLEWPVENLQGGIYYLSARADGQFATAVFVQ